MKTLQSSSADIKSQLSSQRSENTDSTVSSPNSTRSFIRRQRTPIALLLTVSGLVGCGKSHTLTLDSTTQPTINQLFATKGAMETADMADGSNDFDEATLVNKLLIHLADLQHNDPGKYASFVAKLQDLLAKYGAPRTEADVQNLMFLLSVQGIDGDSQSETTGSPEPVEYETGKPFDNEETQEETRYNAPRLFEDAFAHTFPHVPVNEGNRVYSEHFEDYKKMIKRDFPELLGGDMPFEKHFVGCMKWCKDNNIEVNQTSMRKYLELLVASMEHSSTASDTGNDQERNNERTEQPTPTPTSEQPSSTHTNTVPTPARPVPTSTNVPGDTDTPREPEPLDQSNIGTDEVQLTVESMIDDSGFTGDDFVEQLTGVKTTCVLSEVGPGKYKYFTLKAEDFDSQADLIAKNLTTDPLAIEWGRTDEGGFEVTPTSGPIKLGPLRYHGKGEYFFRIPNEAFPTFDPSKKLSYDYEGVTYDITLAELSNYLGNHNTINGYLSIINDQHIVDGIVQREIVSNHVPLIAKPGEPSLLRLVRKLTKGSVRSEAKAQQLLRFVNTQIRYSEDDANSEVEKLQRPNEVLMTGEADCSGKVILYASLLEQAGIDYLVVYMEGHIAIAVKGNFPDHNGMSFSYNGTTYHLVETTVKDGFHIGSTLIGDGNGKLLRLNTIDFVMEPEPDSKPTTVRLSGKNLVPTGTLSFG